MKATAAIIFLSSLLSSRGHRTRCRPHCNILGRAMHMPHSDALTRSSTAAGSFFSYTDAKWVYSSDDVQKRPRYVLSGQSSGCALVPFSRDFFCSTMNALKKQQQGAGASGRETTLLLVGDSIMLHQFKNLNVMLAPAVTPVRDGFIVSCNSSPQRENVRVNFRRDNDLRAPRWIKDACASTVSVISTGAHWASRANGEKNFNTTTQRAFEALRGACPKDRPSSPTVLWRTLPEGHPNCNAERAEFIGRRTLRDMNDWEREVWRVINGSTPVAAGQPNFSKDWHWDLYQRLNVNAEAVLHRHGVTIVDVVPMSRLRPIHGWERYDPSKPLDCLHGDPASRDWNELVVNALAAELCP